MWKILVLFVLVAQISCRPQLQYIGSISDVIFIKAKVDPDWAKMPSSYNQYSEIRKIRTVVHFMDTKDSLLNVDRDFLLENINLLIHATNDRLTKNDKMTLPIGNTTPILDSKIRLDLKEEHTFYHCIAEPFLIKKGDKRNLYDRKSLSDYAFQPDSFLNIFLMPFMPEQIDAGVQKYDKSGIALGNSIKIGGFIQSGEPAWAYAGLLMHELGHVLGLHHSWNTNDGCDDTPRHANCWESTGEPPCDAPVSNNFMDYNPHQSAITPCQIAKMQANIATIGNTAHRLADANWCMSDTTQNRIISDRQKWIKPIQVTGDIIIEKEGALYLSSWLSMAEGTSIFINKGGTLVLDRARIYNLCGLNWSGIVKHPKGDLIITNGTQLENTEPPHKHP